MENVLKSEESVLRWKELMNVENQKEGRMDEGQLVNQKAKISMHGALHSGSNP